jgi:hypothetical protein
MTAEIRDLFATRCGHQPAARVGGRVLTICEACRKKNLDRTTPLAQAIERHPAGKKRTWRYRDLHEPTKADL